MKNKQLLVILFIALASQALFAWGVEGHKLITKKALEALPIEFKSLSSLFNEITDKCIDPDTRKDADKTEGVKHYIDIDFYPEFRQGNMLTDLAGLEQKYTAQKVNKMGILPWAVIDTYNKLVEGMKNGNKAIVVRMMADLAHYIGDAHQPMHTIMNYNGQLSNQTGIHERYESVTIEKNYPEIRSKVIVKNIAPVADVSGLIFEIVENSNILSPSLFYADSIASQECNRVFEEKYYAIFWKFTKNITISQLSNAAGALASLYESAWIAAGKPSLENFK